MLHTNEVRELLGEKWLTLNCCKSACSATIFLPLNSKKRQKKTFNMYLIEISEQIMITLKNAYAPVIMGKEATEKRARIEKATYYSIQNKCRD